MRPLVRKAPHQVGRVRMLFDETPAEQIESVGKEKHILFTLIFVQYKNPCYLVISSFNVEARNREMFCFQR